MIPPAVERTAERYLSSVDQLLPGRITGFYVVGSVALGAYRIGRSDIDFVAVVDGESGPFEIRRLRVQHVRSGLHTAASAISRGRSPLTGTCNGVFISDEDLPAPVSEITSVAGHTGLEFTTGAVGSDVSPVAWKVLADRGIPIRGPDPMSLRLDPQPELLRSWNLGNLERYWRPWAATVERSPLAWFRLRPRWSTAWGALGAPRLHHTIATGEVISKEAAGEYALDVFSPRWHPLVGDALSYWRHEPTRCRLSPEMRGRLTAEFVLEVAASAGDLGPTRPA